MKQLLTLSLATLALGAMPVGQVLAKDKPVELKAAAPAGTNAVPANTGGIKPEHPAEATKPSPFKSDKEKNGYAFGLNIGMNWKRQGVPQDMIDLDALKHGLQDALAGTTPLLTEAEVRATFMAMQQQVMDAKKAEGEKAKADGEKFLADNKAKAGVKTTASGLQYKVIADGKGESPAVADTVTVNYTGMLINGTVFDSSTNRPDPSSFRVGGVIKGWTEALQLMKPGAKWVLYIPSDLAYGENPPPTSGIPAGAPLIFEVELLSATKPPPPPTPPAPITSDIIKVPSAEELKRGAKIETIKAEDVEKEIAKQKAAATNSAKK